MEVQAGSDPDLAQGECPWGSGDKPVPASSGVAGASQGCSGTGCWAHGAFLGEKGRENDAVRAGLQVDMSLAWNFTSDFFDFFFSFSVGIQAELLSGKCI